MDELEQIAATRTRFEREQTEKLRREEDNRGRITIWVLILIAWPILPIVIVPLTGKFGMFVGLALFFTPAFWVWNAVGVVLSIFEIFRRASLAWIAFTTNCVGAFLGAYYIWAFYSGRIPMHM